MKVLLFNFISFSIDETIALASSCSSIVSIKPRVSPDRDDSIYSIEVKYLPEDKVTGLKRWLVNFSEELGTTLEISHSFTCISINKLTII